MHIYHYLLRGQIWLLLVSALTYTVNRSCARFGERILDAVDEAIEMAQKAVARLDSDTDTDFAAVYARIFSSDKSDEQYFPKMRKIMKCIGDLKQFSGKDEKQSHIRFYCDNDATSDVQININAPDANTPPKYVKGKWKPRTDGIAAFADKSNGLLTGSDGLGCAIESILGVTYGTPSPEASSQAQKRARITICDRAFNKASLFKDIMAAADLDEIQDSESTKGVQVLANTLSHTVLHELSHIPSCNTVDYLIDKTEKAYGWQKATSLKPSKAIKNADNYAFLGMFALLADRGYTLPRKDVDTDWDTLGQAGILKYRKDVTKRWNPNPFSSPEYCSMNEVDGKQCVEFEG